MVSSTPIKRHLFNIFMPLAVRIERARVAQAQARNDLRRSEQLAQQGFVAPTRLDTDRLALHKGSGEPPEVALPELGALQSWFNPRRKRAKDEEPGEGGGSDESIGYCNATFTVGGARRRGALPCSLRACPEPTNRRRPAPPSFSHSCRPARA